MICFGFRKVIDRISIDIALQWYNIFYPFCIYLFFRDFLKYRTCFLLIYHITQKLLNEWEHWWFHDQTHDTIGIESLHWNTPMIL